MATSPLPFHGGGYCEIRAKWLPNPCLPKGLNADHGEKLKNGYITLSFSGVPTTPHGEQIK